MDCCWFVLSCDLQLAAVSDYVDVSFLTPFLPLWNSYGETGTRSNPYVSMCVSVSLSVCLSVIKIVALELVPNILDRLL